MGPATKRRYPPYREWWATKTRYPPYINQDKFKMGPATKTRYPPYINQDKL